jgi:hypothetical protein
MTSPTILPDVVALEAVLVGLDPAVADADDLVPALARAYPGLECSIARIDDDYWLGWVFLLTRGHSVEAEIGQAITARLREQRGRLPPDDAPSLLRWANEPYGF